MGKSRGGDSLWDIGIEKRADSSDAPDEKSLLIVGCRDSGKTSIVLRFLDRDEAPKPTTALEYTFGRKSKGHNSLKDVGHIWELGGGASLSKLIDVPLVSSDIMSSGVVMCLDLSSANDIWAVAETLITEINNRVELCLTEAARTDNSVWSTVNTRIDQQYGDSHSDRDLLDPIKIPFVIIGTKYDLYQQLDPEKKKIIAKTLRFLAHNYGASLYFTSVKIESSMNKVRGILSSLVFGTQASKGIQTDPNKPLAIPAGSDSMQSIGSPPISEEDLGQMKARNPLELWKIAFTKFFPQNPIRGKQTEDPTKDVQFSEPVIDKYRLEKDEELERYRKASERRMRELMRQVDQEIADYQQ